MAGPEVGRAVTRRAGETAPRGARGAGGGAEGGQTGRRAGWGERGTGTGRRRGETGAGARGEQGSGETGRRVEERGNQVGRGESDPVDAQGREGGAGAKREEGLGGEGARGWGACLGPWRRSDPGLSHPCPGEDGVPGESSLVQEGRRRGLSCWGGGAEREGPAGAPGRGRVCSRPRSLGSAHRCAAGRFPVTAGLRAFGFFPGRPFSQPPPFPPLAAAPSGRGGRSCPRRWPAGRGVGAVSGRPRDLPVYWVRLWAVELEYRVTRRTPQKGSCRFLSFCFVSF